MSLGILWLCAMSLNRVAPEAPSRPEHGQGVLPPLRTLSWWHGIVLSLLLVGLFFVQFSMLKNLDRPARTSFVSFPVVIDEWVGQRSTLSEAVQKSLGTDDYLNVAFRNTRTGGMVHVLVSWYDHQTTDHAAHAPTSCLVGGGWDVIEKRVLPPSANGDRSFPITQMILRMNGQPLISNFCFLQRGRVVVSEWWNKWYLLADSVTMQRTDGALMRFEMPVPSGKSLEAAQAELDNFVGRFRVRLASHLPEDY